MKYENKSKINQIANHFGRTSQQLKAISELSELSNELSKDLYYKRAMSPETLEEIADCLILIEQLLYFAEGEVPFIYTFLNEKIEQKLDRTLKRIEENPNYY